jgi:5'-nucleotidase
MISRRMTHILLTNDDGYASPGLLALKTALEPFGRISVIAPDRNRSAIARGITIHVPLVVEEVELADGSPAYATDGTPVDCVRLAVLGLLAEPPDLIVSGINLGLNLGDDVTYSGTVAAALEGVMLGIPAIAVSQEALVRGHNGLAREEWDWDFRAAAAFAARLVPMALAERFPRHALLNVNAPGISPDRVAGVRVTRLGRRIYHDELILEEQDGTRRTYRIYGEEHSHHREEGTDLEAVDRGEISVTPLHFELTDLNGMDAMEAWDLQALLREVLARPEQAGRPR